MRSLDELVIDKNKKFHEIKKEYEIIIKSIDEFEKIKKVYESTKVDDKLSVSEAHDIYWILGLVKQQINVSVDVDDLRKKFINSIPELNKYMNVLNFLGRYKNEKKDMLKENIDFSKFGNGRCDEHHFININGHLVCAKCNASTKDYNVTEDDINFLILCAKANGLFLDNIEEKDLPFYNVLMKEYYERLKQRTPLEEIDDDLRMDYAEEYYLEDESLLSEIYNNIKIAKKMDKKEYKINDYVAIEPEYLSFEDGIKLLSEIDERKKQVKESDLKYKDLLLEMCDVARNEVLILRGHNIIDLLNNITTEEELIILAKAYYNLSSSERRVNTEYFKNEKDANRYRCLTANPDINKKILEIKKTN